MLSGNAGDEADGALGQRVGLRVHGILDADGAEDLGSTGVDHMGLGMIAGIRVSLDQQRLDAEAGQQDGKRQTRGPTAGDQNRNLFDRTQEQQSSGGERRPTVVQSNGFSTSTPS